MATLIDNADNMDELVSVLRAIDISVPGRANGRFTEFGKRQREKWTFCRLLSTLNQAGRLAFPIRVEHNDKPDFLLNHGNVQAGVEITECTSEKYSEYLTLAAREFPDAILDQGLFLPGRPALSVKDMRNRLDADRLRSDGWGCLDTCWAEAIHRSIKEKTSKLPNGDIRACNEHWLAIYSNTPFGDVEIETSANLLFKLLEGYWSSALSFTRIFVEHGKSILAVSAGGWERVRLTDLWFPPDPLSMAFEEAEKTDWREFNEQLYDSLTDRGAKQ